MWVMVVYEEENFLRIIQSVDHRQSMVRCLEKPFGINSPQSMEKESNAVFYFEEDIYEAPVKPYLIREKKKFLYTY